MKRWTQVFWILVGTMLLGACGIVGPGNADERQLLHERAQAVLGDFKRSEPGLENVLSRAVGYVVYPRIVTGAFVLGGAAGDGEVYQKGKLVGYSDLSQGSVGLQFGGQRYAEMIIFNTNTAYINFTHNTFDFDAQASAVAISNGAGSKADYNKGVVVLTLTETGLMVQAAIGGQKLRYRDVGP